MSTNSTKQNIEITENDKSQRKPIDLSKPIDFGTSSSLEEVDVTPDSDSESDSEKEQGESYEKTNDDNDFRNY